MDSANLQNVVKDAFGLAGTNQASESRDSNTHHPTYNFQTPTAPAQPVEQIQVSNTIPPGHVPIPTTLPPSYSEAVELVNNSQPETSHTNTRRRDSSEKERENQHLDIKKKIALIATPVTVIVVVVILVVYFILRKSGKH